MRCSRVLWRSAHDVTPAAAGHGLRATVKATVRSVRGIRARQQGLDPSELETEQKIAAHGEWRRLRELRHGCQMQMKELLRFRREPPLKITSSLSLVLYDDAHIC